MKKKISQKISSFFFGYKLQRKGVVISRTENERRLYWRRWWGCNAALKHWCLKGASSALSWLEFMSILSIWTYPVFGKLTKPRLRRSYSPSMTRSLSWDKLFCLSEMTNIMLIAHEPLNGMNPTCRVGSTPEPTAQERQARCLSPLDK